MFKLFIFALCVIAPLEAAEFKSEKECTVGGKVADRQNRVGTIIKLDGPECRVRLDGSGEQIPYLFWMLHAAGGSAETNDKLVIGNYECWVRDQGAGGLRISGPATYVYDGKTGKFHIEPSRRIVFETGPLSSFYAKLLAGPRIGLNQDGGTFFPMACDPAK
jgi:hypothetical protein